MVSINQRLDAEVIELVAGEFGCAKPKFIDMEKQMEMEEEEEEDNVRRFATPRTYRYHHGSR